MACYTGSQSKHAMLRKRNTWGHWALRHVWEADKFRGSYIKIPTSELSLYSHLSLPLFNLFKRLKRKVTCALKVYTTSPKQFCSFWKKKNKLQTGAFTENSLLPILPLIRLDNQFQWQFLINCTLVFSICFINEIPDTSCHYIRLLTVFDFTKTEITHFHFCFGKLLSVSQPVSASQRKRARGNSD